ncbi:type II secretion system protein GspL [Geobacter sp. AOG2]|uniref:type II secretion system protein GspL n=1 Tax=Geobacter sp. AOG2 TaxID=1566347 RepID=UPI001CC4F8AA|nr:type II secretion system protein GspL [Geobacter sp. AOG2]GFE59528.1 type II secretion system protein GspL [Geobacter sp. AOG2]
MDYLVIQVEPHRVLAARFGVAGTSLSFSGAAEFPLNEEQGLSAVAGRIAAGISGGPRIVLCLSPALFAQRTVELPLDNLRKVREILPGQLQGEIALPVEEAVFEALPIGNKRYLALWARKVDLRQAIETFREAGCEPQVVTSAPFAWNFLPECPADAVVCDGAALAVVSEDRVTFARALDAAQPHQSIAATLAALELSGVTLPPRLTIFGEHSAGLAAGDGLPLPAERLGMPDALAPLFKTDESFQQLAGLLAVARACHAGALPDFRRSELAWTAGDALVRKKMIVTAALAAVAVILLFVSKGLEYRAAQTDLASLNKSISAMYREIFPGRTKAVDEVAEVKAEIRKLAGGPEAGNSVLDVLKTLAEAKGATINGLYEAELADGTLRVKGDARSAQAVNEFKAALAPFMASVELGEVKSRPDGSVSFTLAGTPKEVRK